MRRPPPICISCKTPMHDHGTWHGCEACALEMPKRLPRELTDDRLYAPRTRSVH